MDFRLYPMLDLSYNNKVKNFKTDVDDFVSRFDKVGGDLSDNIDIFHFKNFCRFDGLVEDLLVLFVGNHYNLYKI